MLDTEMVAAQVIVVKDKGGDLSRDGDAWKCKFRGDTCHGKGHLLD